MKLAQWMSRLGTETSFEVLAKAKALEAKGKDIVHLEIGEPDFDTPANIRERAKKAIDEGWTHYGPAAGIAEARAAVAEHLSKTRGVNVLPEEVIITPGGKSIICSAMMALLGPGDEAIFPNPGYPIYESLIDFVGAKAVPIHLREENDFNLDLKELEASLSPRTRMLVLNSPANPTGGVMGADALEKIAALLTRYPDVMVLTDEIYSRIIYEGTHHSILSVPGFKERTILLDGLSKAYAMTGWRLGYAAAPKELVTAMARLATNSHSCTATFVQVAAIEALLGPQDSVDKMVAEFRRRRDVIVKGLNALPGFSCRLPKAAFYAFPNVTKAGFKSSQALADLFMDKAGVACLPGTSFGSAGEGYLRFSYANSVENIEKALGQMKAALAQALKA